jgi:hypothetical protein
LFLSAIDPIRVRFSVNLPEYVFLVGLGRAGTADRFKWSGFGRFGHRDYSNLG